MDIFASAAATADAPAAKPQKAALGYHRAAQVQYINDCPSIARKLGGAAIRAR